MRGYRGALALLALAALLATACASAPAASSGRMFAAYDRQLRAAVAVYEETMIAAGEAVERGVIDEQELGQIADVGRRAEASLKAARAALALAIELHSGDPWLAIADAQAAMLELARVGGKLEGGTP